MPNLFDGIPDIVEPAFSEDRREEIEELRHTVNIRSVINLLGCKWNSRRTRIQCRAASHKGGHEKHPSVEVYDDHCYCYVCRKSWDIFGLVQLHTECSFLEAVDWIKIHAGSAAEDIPKPVQEECPYKGPAPFEMVAHWHSCLTEEHRVWLCEKRLLTDATINKNMIGWRPDWKAYSIPFWRGEPRNSLVDIVQFRSSPDSRLFGGSPWHYIGYKGHNRPSIINKHRIGQNVVLLFGTLDALLAGQDGLAAISTNGATAFLRNGDNMERLTKILSGSKVYLVPDKTETELGPAYTLARMIGAEVRHFPKDMPGKDYTDFRIAGGTLTQFLTEVLMSDRAGLIEPEDDEWFENLLWNIRRGDTDSAFSLTLAIENKYRVEVAAMRMNLLTEFDPFEEITHEQWALLRQDIQVCHNYAEFMKWVIKAANYVHANMGGF